MSTNHVAGIGDPSADAPRSILPRLEGSLRAASFLLLLGVALIHLLRLAQPLAVTPDSLSYVQIAEAQLETGRVQPETVFSRWPPGYPLILATLMRLGIASSLSFVGLNLLSVAIGVYAAVVIQRRRGRLTRHAAFYATLVLLSMPVRYGTLYVQSDCVFFGLALVSLALLDSSPGAGWLPIALGLAVVALAISVRTVGILLVPAALFVFVQRVPAEARSRTRLAAGVGLVALAGCVVLDLWVFRSRYLDDQWRLLRRVATGSLSASHEVYLHLVSWGAVSLNGVPLPVGPLRAAASLASGAATVATLAWALVRSRNGLDAPIVFGVAQGAVLLVFPVTECNYWMPLVPLMIGWTWAFVALRPWPAAVRTLIASFVGAWALIGLHSLALNVIPDAFHVRLLSRRNANEISRFLEKYDAFSKPNRAQPPLRDRAREPVPDR